MVTISISSEIAARLQEVARNQHRTVEEVVQEALNRYLLEFSAQGSFAEMARIAVENPIVRNATDAHRPNR